MNLTPIALGGSMCALLFAAVVAADPAPPTTRPVEGKAPGLTAHLLSEDNGRKSWVLAFHRGDEVYAGLTEFARAHDVKSAHLTAIGAFSDATLAWYDIPAKTYRPIPVREEVEVVSFIGNVTRDEHDSPLVHVHCAVADRTGRMTGGHLLAGHVSATLEVFLTEEPTAVHKSKDDALGLELIQ